MASDEQFVSYVRDQMRGAGVITFRKMFGEYAIYSDATVIALVCDNQLFFKPTEAGRALLGSVVEAPPYPQAKMHFLIAEELEDPELLGALALATVRALPVPRPKPSKVKPKTKAKAKSKVGAKATVVVRPDEVR